MVTPVHGRHAHLTRQQESLALGTRRPDHVVLVAMGDDAVAHLDLPVSASRRDVLTVPIDAHGLPLARARNHGVAHALALGADVVVLLDVDVLAGPGLVAAYADAIAARPDVVWSGPVTYLPPAPVRTDGHGGRDGYDLDDLMAYDRPHPARPAPAPGERVLGGEPDLFWSLSFGVSAAAWRTAGGFCEAYVGYGGEDTDLGHTLVDRGVGLGWDGSARGYHQHHPTTDPPTQHVDAILRNGAIFASRWGRWPMEGWLQAFAREGLVRQTAVGWERA